jgi:membrane protein implicated in regulation of membrane protease activity
MSAEPLSLDALVAMFLMAIAIGYVIVRSLRNADDLRDAIDRIEQLEAIIAADIEDEDMQADTDGDYWWPDREDAQ